MTSPHPPSLYLLLNFLNSFGGRARADPVCAKRVVTSRDGYFAPLECLCRGPLSPAHSQKDVSLWKQRHKRFVLSFKHVHSLVDAQTPVFS